ncbi:hypothetical protein AC1031_004518 [Aphanomyces cochlioides]|nr:hypothetical protein AC1031_004518 [Aphanomyces cochlioides]
MNTQASLLISPWISKHNDKYAAHNFAANEILNEKAALNEESKEIEKKEIESIKRQIAAEKRALAARERALATREKALKIREGSIKKDVKFNTVHAAYLAERQLEIDTQLEQLRIQNEVIPAEAPKE